MGNIKQHFTGQNQGIVQNGIFNQGNGTQHNTIGNVFSQGDNGTQKVSISSITGGIQRYSSETAGKEKEETITELFLKLVKAIAKKFGF